MSHAALLQLWADMRDQFLGVYQEKFDAKHTFCMGFRSASHRFMVSNDVANINPAVINSFTFSTTLNLIR